MDQLLLVLSVAFIGSSIAAVAGTGGGIILLPVLISLFGVREAVPMYAVAQLIGNLSRVGFNWSKIEFNVVLWFAGGAIPFAILGSWLFTRIPDAGLLKALGVFLISSVIIRRLHPALRRRFVTFWFAPIGGVFSVVSAIVGSAGPLLAPFYLSYGLIKGAFIGTEALGTAVMHITKISSYQVFGAMSPVIWLTGFVIGPVMIAGSYTGKLILDHIPTHIFVWIVEAVVVLFGIWLLIK
ncbi:MAG TPA: sulfite exporter TauE/SafE family protein [Deltaproteobacteria bacterium]|nr:sulfite exporter TauE/SafE family protein [Deltaproteobacteria bacterium]